MKRIFIDFSARVRLFAAALTLGSISAYAQNEPPSQPQSEVASVTAVDDGAKITPQTRLRFQRGSYKPGIESLRVVKRENTTNLVAKQIAASVALSVFTGRLIAGVDDFSKNDLAGDFLEELKNDPVAVNPAISDLNDALSKVATEIYIRRAANARAVALKDGSTPEEIEEASQIPKEADTPLHPKAWHLVYENLSGSDELFRLKFGAELGRAGFMRPPAVCAYESESVAWAEWQANDWQRLREERAKAVEKCTLVLASTPEKRW